MHMAGAQPKKMLIMHILDILRKYTDENHRLSQKEIGEILKNEYDMVVDRSQQLFYTIEVLDEAISKGRQVSFTYNSYGTDKKLHPRRDSAGNIREYIVNPYQIAAANGRYYLICNYG